MPILVLGRGTKHVDLRLALPGWSRPLERPRRDNRGLLVTTTQIHAIMRTVLIKYLRESQETP